MDDMLSLCWGDLSKLSVVTLLFLFARRMSLWRLSHCFELQQAFRFFFFFGLDDSTSNFPSSFYWYSLNLDSYYLFECFHPHWHSKEYFHLPNWKKSFKKETHSGHAKCRKIHNVGKSNKCLPPYFLEEELCKDVCCVGRLMCLFKYFE